MLKYENPVENLIAVWKEMRKARPRTTLKQAKQVLVRYYTLGGK